MTETKSNASEANASTQQPSGGKVGKLLNLNLHLFMAAAVSMLHD